MNPSNKIPGNIPRNVVWFEALLYMSLTLDALSAAFQDRTPTAEITQDLIAANSIIAAIMILSLVFLVWLAAQRRKNWPRWVLWGALTLSIYSLAGVIDRSGLQFDSAIEIVSSALTVGGMYFSYTGDAKGWFNG
jgi:protein-S-isoprenylcysteine O-methyltransferase Ste14